MRTSASLHRACLASLVALGGSSCSGWQPPWSKAPAVVAQAWQRRTLLHEPGTGVLGTPSVTLDAAGEPVVALADRAFYMGAHAVVLARRGAEGWRVELPLAQAPWRVCARAGDGDGVVLTYGELEGPLAAAAWDGVTLTEAEPGPCPRPSSERREATNAQGAHQLERSRDGKTLWHAAPAQPCGALDAAPGQAIGAFGLAIDDAGRVVAAYLERPEGDQAAAGRLLLATCDAGAWTSSVVDEGVRVIEVGVGLRPDGSAHLAYVVAEEGGERLVHAQPGAPDPAPERDLRIEPAIAACMRLWPTPPPEREGVAAYQEGDALRCAVLERDPTTSQGALAALDGLCESGQARACAVAGSLHHWLMGDATFVVEVPAADATTRVHGTWRGLRPHGVAEDAAQAERRFDRACTLGDARACFHRAALLPFDDPRRLALSTTACEAGLPHACALALAATGLRPDHALLERAEPPLRAACEAGDAAACGDLGVALHLRGDGDGARVALDRACRAKVEPACQGRQRLP